jgi:hypothetical protein
MFEDQAYEWHETTNHQDVAAGRRVFIRGCRRDPAAEMRAGIEAIAQRLSTVHYQHEGIDPDGLKVLISDLRGLL